MMCKSKKILRQSLAMMTVYFNQLNAGIGMGWVAPTLHYLQSTESPIPITSDQSSWIASIDSIGKIFGCLSSALLLDIIGRKPLLTSSALIFAFSWFLVIFDDSVFTIYIMRTLYGIAYGIQSTASPVYLGENSSSSNRGIFGTMVSFFQTLGIFFEFIIATYLPYRITAIINCSIAFLPSLATYWLREPVQFLLLKGCEKQAVENYMWLNDVTKLDDVGDEFDKIKLNVRGENSKRFTVEVLTSPANYKSLFIMVILHILLSMIGFAAITSYTLEIFTSSRILTSNQFTILLGAIQLATSIIVPFFAGRFNRRPLLLIAFTAIAIVHACTAVLYYVQDEIRQIIYFPWLVFVTISIFTILCAFAFPTLFFIRGELFPLSIRAVGTSITVISLYTGDFVVIKIFTTIQQCYGIYYNFVLYFLSSCTMVIFVYLFLPETRNKTLIEIQQILEINKRTYTSVKNYH